MSSPAAVALGAGVCLLAGPYLARLTLTVPDREATGWWRGAAATPRRVLVTAVLAAALGALAGAAAGLHPALAALVALALVGAPLIVIDVEHHRLPNRLVFTLAGAVAVLFTLAAVSDPAWGQWLRALEGAAAVFAVLFLLAFISPSSFGFGDVKLGGVLGACLGWFGWGYVYYGIFAGFLIGALLGVGLLVGRRGSMKTPIAFGPMLIVGSLLVLAFDLVPNLSGA